MPKKKQDVTRYGAIKKPDAKFGGEERFAWQKAKFCSDVMYDMPSSAMTKSVVFSTSSRKGMDDDNPDQKKRSTGPGSYDFAHCYDHNSEYVTKPAYRFTAAPRQSMALKTPSPGPVYNIDKQFYTGPVKNEGISFNTDSRKPLYGGCASADADMLLPKLSPGPAITIGKKLKFRDHSADTPGSVYDVQKYINFKTGPAFSFGMGRGLRFSNAGFLPELDD